MEGRASKHFALLLCGREHGVVRKQWRVIAWVGVSYQCAEVAYFWRHALQKVHAVLMATGKGGEMEGDDGRAYQDDVALHDD